MATATGVSEKDITDTGVKAVTGGMVIDVTKATARRNAEEERVRYVGAQIDTQRALIDSISSRYDAGIGGKPGVRLTDAQRSQMDAQVNQAEARIAQLQGGEAPAGPQQQGQSFLQAGTPLGARGYEGPEGPQETLYSQIMRMWEGLDPAANPEIRDPVYQSGFSPEEIEQRKFDNYEAKRDADTAAFFEQFPPPAQFSDVFGPGIGLPAQVGVGDRPGLDGTGVRFMGEGEEGQYFSTPNGGDHFANIDKESWSQETADALSATKKFDQLVNAVANEEWDMLPDFISNAQAQHIFGPNSPITYEDMSAFGYSMDDFGNWVHEEVDEQVQFNPGYGDYAGGYGGGGGGGGYEPDKNTYAGGRSEQQSGAFAKRQADRAQAGGLGAVNWRI